MQRSDQAYVFTVEDGVARTRPVRHGERYEGRVEIVEGLQFDHGYTSPYFVTDAGRMEAELNEGTLSIAFFARYDDAFLGREDAGLFYGGGIDQLSTQALMVGVHFVFVFGAAFLLFHAIKATIGLRVTEEEELAGLDVEEHGHMGYAPDSGTSGGSYSSTKSTTSVPV